MTRGDQRERAREKNSKNAGGRPAKETDANQGLSLQERQLRDAQRMREKQQQALQKKATDGDGGGAAAAKP